MCGCYLAGVDVGIKVLNQHDSYLMRFNSKISYDEIKVAFYCMRSDFNRILCVTKCEKTDIFCLLWCIFCGLTV